MRWTVRFLVIALLVAGTVFWSRESDLSTTTRYCPWKHRVGFTPQVCKVKDERAGKILVEHANLDTNKLELSIYQDGATRWIQHTEGRVRHFSDALDENTLKFDPADPDGLIVNGERFPITYLVQEE